MSLLRRILLSAAGGIGVFIGTTVVRLGSGGEGFEFSNPYDLGFLDTSDLGVFEETSADAFAEIVVEATQELLPLQINEETRLIETQLEGDRRIRYVYQLLGQPPEGGWQANQASLRHEAEEIYWHGEDFEVFRDYAVAFRHVYQDSQGEVVLDWIVGEGPHHHHHH